MKYRLVTLLLVGGALALTASAADAKQEDCVVPTDNMVITDDTTLCQGVHHVPDSGKDGAIQIKANNVLLDCDGATLVGARGEDAGLGIVSQGGNEGYSGITIRNCVVNDYGTDMSVGSTSDVLIENNTFGISERGKGLQLGNMDRAVDNIVVRNNIFRGVGNGLSFGSEYPATNVWIDRNIFDVTIDAVVVSGGPYRNAYRFSRNQYDSVQGEIIGLHDSDGTVIEWEQTLNNTVSNFLVRRSNRVVVRHVKMERSGLQIEESSDGVYNANIIGRNINVTSGSNNNAFVNNVVTSTENWALRASDTSNNAFVNNTFRGGRNMIVLFEGASSNNTLKNNIMSGTNDAPVLMLSGVILAGLQSNYNNMYTTGDFAIAVDAVTYHSLEEWQQATGLDRHSLSVDPGYTVRLPQDYHLRPDSLMIDAGDPSTQMPRHDVDGEIRPQKGGYDMGADEVPELTTQGVDLFGEVAYEPGDGYAAHLTIVDLLNPQGVLYAISPDRGAQWLQSNSQLGPTPYYSSSTTWTHEGIPATTTNIYRFAVRSENGTQQTALSSCGLVLTTGSQSASSQTLPNLLNRTTRGIMTMMKSLSLSSSPNSLDASNGQKYQCDAEPLRGDEQMSENMN
jgi:hypothetical protein